MDETLLLRDLFVELHEAVRAALADAVFPTEPVREAGSDTQYGPDAAVTELVRRFFRGEVGPRLPCLLFGEGIAEEEPLRCGRGRPRWRVLMDPVDGTRGLLHGKRPGWVLTAAAPERGEATRLAHVCVAVQTELPTPKQGEYDRLWAIRGQGARAERISLRDGAGRPLRLQPSRADHLEHGYAQISRFFPGGKDLLALVEERVLAAVAPRTAGRAHVFEDQYASNAGQLYEILLGRDRFVADLRPRLQEPLRRRGEPPVITSHPHDLATALIAAEAGVILTDPWGRPFDAPCNATAEVGFIAYANRRLQARIEPVLLRVAAEVLGP